MTEPTFRETLAQIRKQARRQLNRVKWDALGRPIFAWRSTDKIISDCQCRFLMSQKRLDEAAKELEEAIDYAILRKQALDERSFGRK